jgi:hypothetical protein
MKRKRVFASEEHAECWDQGVDDGTKAVIESLENLVVAMKEDLLFLDPWREDPIAFIENFVLPTLRRVHVDGDRDGCAREEGAAK